MMFTSPTFTTHHQPRLRRDQPERHGPGRQLHRLRPAERQPRRASPPTAARTGSRAASRAASTRAARSRRRPTAAGSSGRPSGAGVYYSVGFGNSWTAVHRPPGRTPWSSPTGSTRTSSTASPAGRSTSAPTAARPSRPPPRPGCRPTATSSSRPCPAARATSGWRRRRARPACGTPPTAARRSPSWPASRGGQRRLRQGRARPDLPGAVRVATVDGVTRRLPLRRHRRQLGPDQRRPAPVRQHGRGDHRRPADLRPGLPRHQRPGHPLRRQRRSRPAGGHRSAVEAGDSGRLGDHLLGGDAELDGFDGCRRGEWL